MANQITNNVTILLGNGSGGFTASPSSPFNAGSLPYFIVAGDFNGDGTEDLAVANLFGNNVTVLLGNGAGGFSAAPGSPFAVGRFPYSVAAGTLTETAFRIWQPRISTTTMFQYFWGTGWEASPRRGTLPPQLRISCWLAISTEIVFRILP